MNLKINSKYKLTSFKESIVRMWKEKSFAFAFWVVFVFGNIFLSFLIRLYGLMKQHISIPVEINLPGHLTLWSYIILIYMFFSIIYVYRKSSALDIKYNKMKLKFLLCIFLYLFSFSVKADYAEEIKKEHLGAYKVQLDLENDHRHFCGYMFSLFQDVIGKLNSKKREKCYKHVCTFVINVYKKTNETDYRQKYGFWLFYKNNPFEIIGIDIDPEDIMDYKNRKEEIERTKIYVLLEEEQLGIPKKSHSLNAIEAKNKKIPKDKSYIKVTGCRVDEFKIINNKTKN